MQLRRPVIGFSCSVVLLALTTHAGAQLIYYADKIYSPYTLQNEKAVLRKQKMIAQANALATMEYPAQADEIDMALWSVGQFMIKTDSSTLGIEQLVGHLPAMPDGLRRSFLEVIYGLYPTSFYNETYAALRTASSTKAFAIAALHVARIKQKERPALRSLLQQRYPNFRSDEMLSALYDDLGGNLNSVQPPDLDSLFAHQRLHGFKMVYSFQRPDRNQPGLAVVQLADGSFMRRPDGSLKTFQQLARSASNLPWYIQHGNTPQGLFAITGTAISKNISIGPTPNLQLVMLGEVNPPQFTHYFPIVFNAPPERLYRSYFPESWQHYTPIMQSYRAGQIGRSAIIAHGTTIDPAFFEGYPFYPLSPSLGCLSGREIWNGSTGKIESSDQLDLVNAFIETQGTKGYLLMLELDEIASPVTPQEVELFISRFEKNVLPTLPARVDSVRFGMN